jgi:hypothetical protein
MLGFAKICVLLRGAALLQCCRISSAQETSDGWWLKPFRMFQTNLRAIDADLDVEGTLDFLEQHGANAWLLSVGGILANYPTELDFQAYNALQAEGRDSGDLVRDARRASAARDIRLLARMDFSKIEVQIADEHPEWAYISPTGERQIHHAHDVQLVSMCPSGQWYQEKIYEILQEVTANYELDGFFINWSSYNENDYNKTYVGVCQCESCQSRWDTYSGGKPLPYGPENSTYPEWKTFSDGMIASWTSDVREYVKERLPNAGLIQRREADVMFYEANNAVDRTFWHHATGEAVSAYQSYRPDVPVLVNAASFLDHGYRICSEQPENYIQYFIQAISRGANPSTYIIGLPEGEIEWLGLDNAGIITRFHQKWTEIYEGFRPIAKTALVQPISSFFDNDTRFDESESEYRGLYQALQELHKPFDVLSQSFITNASEVGSLARYQVIILPDLGALSTDDVATLDTWVAGGGTLVTTGAIGFNATNTTTDDGAAIQLQSLPAQSMLENLTSVESLWSTYMAPPQNKTASSQYTAPLIPVIGSYHRYAWKPNTTTHYQKLAQAPWAPIEYTYGNTQTVSEPGCGVGTHGNGTAAVVTFPVGRGYNEIGYSVYRDFFALVLDELTSEEQEELAFDLAEQVEITLNRNAAGATVVHLINLSGARTDNFGSHLPIPAGTIRVPGGNNGNVTARALVSEIELEVVDGTIQLPGLDLFEVVVIEGM